MRLKIAVGIGAAMSRGMESATDSSTIGFLNSFALSG